MSWQTYVDTNLIGTGKVQKAAIFGHDGSCWATSSGFTMSADEAKELIKSLKDGSVSGKTIEGQRYMMLRNDTSTKTAYLKLKGHGGFAASLTAQTMIVGGYDESGASSAGALNNIVENLAQYLNGAGF